MSKQDVLAVYGTTCQMPGCARPATEIHEVFILRSDIPGEIERIRVPENAIPICRYHHTHARNSAQFSQEGRYLAARAILRRFTPKQVSDAITAMGLRSKATIRDALSFLQGVVEQENGYGKR